MPRDQPPPVDIVLVHSSDLHVDDEDNATKHSDGVAGLAAVLAAARDANADIVLLAGDTFDNNRVPAPVLTRTPTRTPVAIPARCLRPTSSRAPPPPASAARCSPC